MKWRCGGKQLRDGGRERGKKERKRDREGVSEGGRERERGGCGLWEGPWARATRLGISNPETTSLPITVSKLCLQKCQAAVFLYLPKRSGR